ncbi:MAG: formate--tetrahydrofolate ligase, partial [SAR324 cluster bacterium]|nr:formate--tetrahydrofolate ligase [SAR324 cluster bacterium]
EVVARGGDGGTELAKTVKRLVDETPGAPSYLYDLEDNLKTKIEAVAREIYRADGVDYTEEAEASIARLEKNQLDRWPVCMAKTQSSLSDDPKKKNAPRGWRLQVRDVKVSNGAGFIVALTGKMMLMPGMPKEAAFNRIDIDSEGRISGLS